jgi:SAM-dependent methyltransferase
MTGFANPAQTWNQRYQGEDFLFGTEPNHWLARHASVWKSGDRVLCVADGEGRNSVWLAQRGLQVDAFDIAEVGVAKARAFAEAAGTAVNFQVADVDSFAWPTGTYDGIAAIFIQFAPPAQRARLFERMVQALKPGGVLILQGYSPQQLVYKTGGPGQIEHLYTEDLLRQAFAGMKIEVLESYEADIAEGSGHRGHSALIGMVARKT